MSFKIYYAKSLFYLKILQWYLNFIANKLNPVYMLTWMYIICWYR